MHKCTSRTSILEQKVQFVLRNGDPQLVAAINDKNDCLRFPIVSVKVEERLVVRGV